MFGQLLSRALRVERRCREVHLHESVAFRLGNGIEPFLPFHFFDLTVAFELMDVVGLVVDDHDVAELGEVFQLRAAEHPSVDGVQVVASRLARA